MVRYDRYVWPPQEPTEQGEIWNGRRWVKATPEEQEEWMKKNEEYRQAKRHSR